MTNNLLRTRRKQIKAAARLNNFINKQDHGILETEEYVPAIQLATQTLMQGTSSLRTPLNNTKKNKQQNKQQNRSEDHQRDILVDSLPAYLLPKEVSKEDHLKSKHLQPRYFDIENFSFIKNLSISYLHPNSAYPQSFTWLSPDLEIDIINEPCLTKYYVPQIINTLMELMTYRIEAVRPQQMQHSIIFEINKAYDASQNFLKKVKLNRLNTFLRRTNTVIMHNHNTDHQYTDLYLFHTIWIIPFPRRDNCGVPRDLNKSHGKKCTSSDFISTSAINLLRHTWTTNHFLLYYKEYPPPIIIGITLMTFYTVFVFFFTSYVLFFILSNHKYTKRSRIGFLIDGYFAIPVFVARLDLGSMEWTAISTHFNLHQKHILDNITKARPTCYSTKDYFELPVECVQLEVGSTKRSDVFTMLISFTKTHFINRFSFFFFFVFSLSSLFFLCFPFCLKIIFSFFLFFFNAN